MAGISGCFDYSPVAAEQLRIGPFRYPEMDWRWSSMIEALPEIWGFVTDIVQQYWQFVTTCGILAGFFALRVLDNIFHIFDILRR